MEDLSDGAHQQRLGQPRRTGDQAVSPGKQADQQLLDDLLLADNDLGQLGVKPLRLPRICSTASVRQRKRPLQSSRAAPG